MVVKSGVYITIVNIKCVTPWDEIIPRIGSSRIEMKYLAKSSHSPFPAEARQALLAGEQFLHGAFFDLALLVEKLLQGFDEGIRVA